MITYNDIRITNDYPRLLSIDIVDETDAIEDVTVVFYSDMGDDGTYDSEKAYRHEIVPETEDVHHYHVELSVEGIKEECDMEIGSFDKALFYVIINTEDATTEELHTYTAVIPDWLAVYNAGMPFVAQIAAFGFDKCDHASGFEEFIVLWNALKLAFSSGDYAQINMLWNKFLRFIGTSSSSVTGCPCSN